MIFFLLFCIPVEGWMFMKHSDPPKMWQFVSGNLKESARNWFIHRAEKAGVPWHDITNSFTPLHI